MSRLGVQTRQGSQVQTWSQPYVPPVSYLRGKTTYARPSDWPSEPSATGQEIEFLMKVYESNSNLIAFKVAGNYNVNWGDGTSANFSASAQAERNIQWADAPSATVTSQGFRFVRVVITPQAGANLTYADFNIAHSSVSAQGTRNQDTQIAEMAVSGSNFTSFTFASESIAPSFNVRQSSLRSFKWSGVCNVTNFSGCFYNMLTLEEVNFDSLSAMTSACSMFYGCGKLRYLNLPNLGALTNAANMFAESSIEQANLEGVTALAHAESMFSTCRSLQYVSLIGTTSLSNTNSMFSTCISLQNVYLPDLKAVTNAGSMFVGATALASVKLAMPAVTNAASMFNSCANLVECDIGHSTSLTDVSSMFSGSGIKNLELKNCAGFLNMGSMFLNCKNLETVTFDSLSAATSANAMFQGCTSIRSVVLTDARAITNYASVLALCTACESIDLGTTTSAATSFGQAFFNAQNLKEIKNLDTRSATTFSSIFSGAAALPSCTINASSMNSNFALSMSSIGSMQRIEFSNMKWDFNIASNRFQAAELDNIYTDVDTLPTAKNFSTATVAGSTVTVTTTAAHTFWTGMRAVVAGVNPSTFNGTYTITVTASNQFTYTKSGAGTYVSGGTATPSAVITVTGNPGTASDSPSIATNKGWTVTG